MHVTHSGRLITKRALHSRHQAHDDRSLHGTTVMMQGKVMNYEESNYITTDFYSPSAYSQRFDRKQSSLHANYINFIKLCYS